VPKNKFAFVIKKKIHREIIDNSSLWHSFKLGNKNAFEQLYNLYFKELGSYGMRLSSSKIVVEDAIHDIFIDLWRRKEYLSEVENIKFYLFRSLRNQLSRTLQKDIFEGAEDVNNFLDYLSTISTEQESIDSDTNQQQRQSIQRALGNLSYRQAEVIHLRFYQGLSLDEVASIMQIPKQVVKNLLSKSYAILRISLKNLFSIALFASLI
jgi:RNA polymerase sigma-70 factor (ECF subfamily)